jgi:hypothetical protein
MAGSIDKVLQSDGTYKWEVAELKPKTQESVKASPASTTKETKKKVSKKKTTNPLSE